MRTLRKSYHELVNRYREKTEGKFPSPSDTMKDVGGSYYVVRQILQEMIYNSKQSSMACKDTSLDKSTRKKNEMIYNSKESEDIKDISLEKSAIKNHEMVSNAKEQSMYTNDTSLEKSTMKEDRRSTKFEEDPQSRELGKGTRPILKDIEISSSMIFQSKQGQESSVSNEVSDETPLFANIIMQAVFYEYEVVVLLYACDASSSKIYCTVIYCPMFVSFMVDYNTVFCYLCSIYICISISL